MRMMSIRQYLGLLVLAIMLLAAIVLSLFKIYWFDPHVKIETEQRQFLVSDVLSHQIKIYLATSALQLEGVAALAQDTHADWTTLKQALDAQVNVSGFLDATYIVDLSGKVGAVGLPAINENRRAELLRQDMRRNPLFLRAVQSEKTVWSDSFKSGPNKELFIGFAIPAKNRIVLGEISLEKMWLNLERASEDSKHVVLILDKQGRVILDQHGQFFNNKSVISNIPAIRLAIESQQTASVAFTLDGNEVQGVITPVENTDLIVVYAEPATVANAISDSITITTIVFLLFILALGTMAAFFISRKIASQFSVMAQLASQVATGVASTETAPPGPILFISEFVHLADSIKQTAYLLSQQERQMQLLINHLPGVVYRVRNDNVPDAGFLSAGCINLVGYTNTQLQANGLALFRKLIHHDDLAYVDQVKQQCIDGNQSWQVAYRIRGKDGSFRLVNDCGRGVIDSSNGVMYREGFISDITEKKRFELDKAANEARMRTLLGNLPVVLSVVDENGIFTLCEGLGLKKTGLASGELVGKSFIEHYAEHPEILADFRRCMAGECAHGQSLIHGSWYELIYEPILDQDNRPAGAIMIKFDISNRKNAELKLHSISSLLAKTQSMTHIGAWAFDVLTNEIYWSDETYQIHGVSPRTFTPTVENIVALFTPESRAVWASAVEETIRTGESHVLELSLRTPAGQLRQVKAVGEVIIENGKVTRILGAVQDITEFKRTENELRTHQQHLEELVEQRTLELVVARDAAENAARAKSHFMANTSHEIRTPINAILGFTRLALNTVLTAKQRNYLEKVNISSNLLLNLINGILDFSKIEAGQLELAKTEFTLAEVLEKVSTVTAQKAHDKNLEFLLNITTDVNRTLVGDPIRLSQVLINLCGNAVKFTDCGQIILSVVMLPHPGPDQMTLEFSVRDSGIGLSAQEMRMLFKPFSQVDNSNTRRYGGTGLGLAISRQLVEMMGGHIWVESTPEVGSEFKFTASFGAPAQAQHPLIYPVILGLKALVVDASPSSREIHCALLSSLGYEASSAASLGEAVESLRSTENTPYDFVLLDGKMLQGQEQHLHALKTAHATKAPRIILMTAETLVEKHPEIQTAADGHISKPVLAPPLLDAIMTVFGCHRRTFPVLDKPPAAALPREALRGRRVLLVEDNDFNQEVAYEILREAGIVTTVANNGQEAIDLAMAQPFDLVLMDIQMPVMDGLDATLRLRCAPQLQSLPIIAMTAHALVDEQNQCLAVGMNDFLSKPVDPEILLATLMKWIAPLAQPALLEEAPTERPTPELSQHLPSSIAGISLETGLNYSGGNVDFYLKMLHKFLHSKSGAAQEIKTQIDLGDLESARRIAHTHKSIAAHIGAEKLSAAAALLEKSLREGETETIQARLLEFTQASELVTQALHNALDGQPPSAATSMPEAALDIPYQLHQLAALLQHDIGKALKLERALRPAMEKSPVAHDFAQFQQYLRAWDAPAAAVVLQRLITSFAVEPGVS
ncbi:MAG: multi-sensor hybrid histidine kinase [Proteobacteria bacterium]|nr:multi-sensor hybrid histidine kinase [Pseudomonadota bacterium]